MGLARLGYGVAQGTPSELVGGPSVTGDFCWPLVWYLSLVVGRLVRVPSPRELIIYFFLEFKCSLANA
jgi:hypothetical protein